METTASVGVLVGALASAALSASTLSRILAVVVLASALAAGRRKGMRTLPQPTFDAEPIVPGSGAIALRRPRNCTSLPVLTLTGVPLPNPVRTLPSPDE